VQVAAAGPDAAEALVVEASTAEASTAEPAVAGPEPLTPGLRRVRAARPVVLPKSAFSCLSPHREAWPSTGSGPEFHTGCWYKKGSRAHPSRCRSRRRRPRQSRAVAKPIFSLSPQPKLSDAFIIKDNRTLFNEKNAVASILLISGRGTAFKLGPDTAAEVGTRKGCPYEKRPGRDTSCGYPGQCPLVVRNGPCLAWKRGAKRKAESGVRRAARSSLSGPLRDRVFCEAHVVAAVFLHAVQRGIRAVEQALGRVESRCLGGAN
jgi:hypothetical protein